MSRRKLTDSDLAARAAFLGKALVLCRRDDAGVAKEVHDTKTADTVEALDKVAFFDEFFAFLQRLGIMSLLQQLDPGTRLRASISWVAMVGVYVMRILAGVPSIPQTEGLLLTDPALMALFGMATFVEKGMTRRGLSRANQLPEVRGAFSGEAMVDALVKCSLLTLARVFNAVIRILAEKGYFPKHVHAVVDCTDLEATPKYRMLPSLEPRQSDGQAAQKGAQPFERVTGPVARVKRKKRPDHRNNRHAPKVETMVWGWKVWLMFCPTSGLPIAMYVDRINADDRRWMLTLVHQGKANIGERLKSVVFDRGFWDGQDLCGVAKVVPFFIPGKSDLEVTKEARRLAQAAFQQYLQGRPVEDAIVATRAVIVVRGRGKHRREEQQNLIVVGLTGLDCPTYAEEPPDSRVNSKSYVAPKLNCAVVMADPSYPRPADDEKHLVILTCAKMATESDVLFAYDRFDERGVIENSANKEAKQAWKLEAPLEKSEAAVYLHAHFVFMLMALLTAFRAEQQSAEAKEVQGQETGMARYRRQVERANRAKVLVRIGERYGVFYAWEFAILAGLRLRHHPAESAESILARYGTPDPKGQAP